MRRHYLKEGDELVMPATLFLYVLKKLKEENFFDSIRMGEYETNIRKIFGNEYVDNNWEYIKPFLIEGGWIETFSGFMGDNELVKFIKITAEGEWLITNGVPGEWCRNAIEAVAKKLKIKD